MTWFVTGATGSIGSTLVDHLDGHVRLALLVRADSPAAAHRRLAGVLGARGRAALADGVVEAVPGDLRAPDLGLPRLQRAKLRATLDGVLHIAARTDFGGETAADYRDDNVRGALHALELAADAGCPLLHVSTAYVSGVRDGLVREDELDVGQAHRNGYERSKLEAEAALTTMAGELGVPLTIFRPSIVLPDAPRADAPEGPGPLAYLRLLANLEGRRASRERVIRYRGDPQGRLNLVPMAFVVQVLARALREGARPGAVYHVTARRSFPMSEVSALMNESLVGLRTELVPDLDPESLDRYEALLERTFRIYSDYLFLQHEYDRSALDRDFGVDDGADADWLRGVYARHLDTWRAERPRARVEDAATRAVRAYFADFLPQRTGRRLVPGLASLTVAFTVTVPGAGSHELSIEEGVLTAVRAAAAPSQVIDYEVDAPTLLSAVSGRERPAELFFARRVAIRGDLYRALSTATALEDFFRLHPYTAAAPAGAAPEPVA